jgi:Cd2+/Zn2+-exporting ATPase
MGPLMHTQDEEYKNIDHNHFWLTLILIITLTTVITITLDVLFQGVPLGFKLPLLNKPATVSQILIHTLILSVSAFIGFNGIKNLLINKRFSIEFLMAAAATGALYLGFLFEAITVLLLYSIAEHFEDYIEDKARKTIEKLTQFLPDEARILTEEGQEVGIHVSDVTVGSTIIVKPGEKIPVDGIVTFGESYVNQSLVTGESTPIPKKTRDYVFAGTINISSLLKIKANKKAEDTLVSRIVKLVIQSRKRKATIEKFVDKFAKFYVPIVITIALLTTFIMPTLTSGSFEIWLYRALILLVISCPSAFIISVPATLFTAVTIAARNGAIVKGGIYIEKMAQVRAVLFDKTGTLTLGKPIVHCIKESYKSDERALMYAAALDQYSNHPLAQAIVKKAEMQNLNFKKLDVQKIKEVPGQGIKGLVNGVQVVVGSMELLQKSGSNCECISEFYKNEKHSAVCISIDNKATASVCIVDQTRDDASQTIKELKAAKLHLAILTGDKTEIAKETAQNLNVDTVYSELLPEDKLRIISQTRKDHGPVAMVGDGVNDAPALAASDVGLAMGRARVDTALDSADVILTNDELGQIPKLLNLSKMSMRISKQNIALAIGVKIILGISGLMGFVPLWFTVASGDDGLTMLTLLNTLRLSRFKR